GYTRLQADNAVFTRTNASGTCTLAIHVDNFLSFASSSKTLDEARKELHLTFEMKEEDPNWIMGFQLIDNPQNGTVSISHRQYIETTIKRFRLGDAHPLSTPMDHSVKLSRNDSPQTREDIADMRHVPYREIVGS